MVYAQHIRDFKRQIARFIKIGELAQKAGIDELDPEILLGGFFELAKRQEQYNGFYNEGVRAIENEKTLTFVKIDQRPDNEALSKLRKLHFYYDPFNARLFGPSCHKQQALSILKATHS